MPIDNIERFEPAAYPLAVNAFLVEHAGEAPELALRGGLPPGVGGMADIQPILERLYRLDRAAEHGGQPWCGVQKIKDAAQRYLIEYEKWANARARGGPAYPTQYTWDAFGRGHKYGVGSDASDMVRTYFDEQGNRRPLGVDLFDTDAAQPYVPEWMTPAKEETPVVISGIPLTHAAPLILEHDEVNGRWICPICKFTQSYDLGSHQKLNMAKARMSRHLQKAKKEPDLHKQLWSNVFGGVSQESGGMVARG